MDLFALGTPLSTILITDEASAMRSLVTPNASSGPAIAFAGSPRELRLADHTWPRVGGRCSCKSW